MSWVLRWLQGTMGNLFTRLTDAFGIFRDDPARVLMVGLDAAGKTTILYKLKLNEVVTTIPTIGFNVETVTPVKGLQMTVWDIGGQEKIRALWRHYFPNTEGILYVVDSADRERFSEAREELQRILEDEQMRGVPVVLLANKQDMHGAVGVSKVAEELQMTSLKGRKWHVQGTCAPTGDGVFEGMHELARLVKDFKKSQHTSW